MRFVSPTLQAASGRLAGFVASHGRAGGQLRAHTPRTQPHSVSQTNSRHITGSLASLWRSLPTAAHAAWEAAALTQPRHDKLGLSHALSGYALFVSTNRRLATLGFGYQLTEPGPSAAIPPIQLLEVIATYTQLIPPQTVVGMPLWIDPTIPAPYCAVVRASASLSQVKHHLRKSDFRVIGVFVPYPTFSIDTLPGWLAIYGTLPGSGTITFEVNLIDPRTGYIGAPRRCSVAYVSAPVPVYSPGAVTIGFNGVDVAVIDDTEISFGGVPVAGGQ